ncbi:MAG TPA: hypothetical protein PLL30_03800 [Candidatus Krumholzibacteria bacterium]|nr:hypothetical protein [Candidatus Krumholzibacteria bacterium]HPD70898.1 hypothetical protein [Candidatus Krumholzibacteria bacterium]HRY39402.1 hypothetical protein [Candidatus Krumholzibacteria bacterium]
MSDRDDLDLDDDLLLDEDSDAPVGEWNEDLLEDFPADDPAALDPVPARPAKVDVPEVAAPAAARTKVPGPTERRQRSRPTGASWLVFLLVLLVGASLGGGLLAALGATPGSLIDGSGFRDLRTIGDVRAHPANAFWFGALVTLAAAIVAAAVVARSQRALQRAIQARDALLGKYRGLNPDDLESWRREDLQADPDLAALTTGVVGHFSLQQARLKRYVGLEGELHRLEQAMADNDANGLNGDWENPVAGSLADQALRLLVARDELADSSAKQQQGLVEQGADLVANLRDARSWQNATLEQLNHQGAAVESISRQLGKLVAARDSDDAVSLRRDRLRQAIEAVRHEIASVPARAGDRDAAGAPASFAAVVERASRLAFQIAMEVARLGAKGERLLPLTQDLEELTTELRATADQGKLQPGAEDPRIRVLENVRGRLAELDPDALAARGPGDLAAAVGGLAPAIADAATGLARLAQCFPVQTARLAQGLDLASALTGIQVDDSGDPQAEPGSGLLVDRFNPFGSGALPEGGLVADPFASTGASLFDVRPESGTTDFARTFLPGQEDLVRAVDEPRAEPAAAPEPPRAAAFEARPAPPPRRVADLGASPLPPVAEKVYDLAEFDARRLPPDRVAESQVERIHELREFGAVRIG